MKTFTKVVKLRLFTTKEQNLLLKEMSKQYQLACNYVSKVIFDNNFQLNVMKLNKLLYRKIRSNFKLKAQLTQSTFRTTVSKYKTVQTQLIQKNKTLEWLYKPIKFQRPQCDLVHTDDYSFINNGSLLSIITLDKRIHVKFAGSIWSKYLNSSWKLGTAKLLNVKGIWYLHIPVSKNIEEFNKESIQHVVGIDRGLRFIAVTYDEQDKTSFIKGGDLLYKRHKYLKVRQQLQSKGTKSAKRVLRRLSGRENRWITDVNHCISKTLVKKYGSNTLFVLEDLTGISLRKSNLNHGKKFNNDLRSWSFYQLEQFLTYKAHEVNSEVIKVSARYTSQRCPKCGTINKNNRHHAIHEYICQCGYHSNDDRIGAMNIQLLGTLWVSGEINPHFEKQL